MSISYVYLCLLVERDTAAIMAGPCENVTSDLGLGGGFPWVLRFPQPVTTSYLRFSRNMAEKVTKNRNSKYHKWNSKDVNNNFHISPIRKGDKSVDYM